MGRPCLSRPEFYDGAPPGRRAAFFLIADAFEHLMNEAEDDEYGPVIEDSVRIAWEGFSQYSQGVVLVAITNATVVTIVLLIMGVPLAIPLGIIVFFGAFIPYIGAPIAMFLAAFVALVTNGPLAGALVVVLIFIIGQLEGNVLQPLIMGKTVNLHPMAIVLVTAAGAAYFGLIGALIGVPLAAGVYGVMKYLRGDPVPLDEPEPSAENDGNQD